MPNSDSEKKPEPPRPAPDHPKAGFYRKPLLPAHDDKPAGKLPEVAPAGRYLAPMSFAPSIYTLALPEVAPAGHCL